MTTLYSQGLERHEIVSGISRTAEMPSILDIPRQFLRQVSTFIHNLKRRRKFVTLLDYNDRIIDDMGLTRELIEEASRLPVSDNAAIIVRTWAKSRK